MDPEKDKNNALLLDLIHEALKKWKRAENLALEDSNMITRSRNIVRAEALRNIYMALYREAAKRDLTLSTEQLLDRILYECDDI